MSDAKGQGAANPTTLVVTACRLQPQGTAGPARARGDSRHLSPARLTCRPHRHRATTDKRTNNAYLRSGGPRSRYR